MAMKASYLTVEGEIRSEHRTGDTHTRDFVLDALGSVVEVFQGTGVVADASYKPYGAMVNGSWNMTSYKFRWLGGWGYRYTGLDWVTAYVRARHYSYNDGTWTSVDPLWPGEAAYRYVNGRVTRNVDPSGNIAAVDDLAIGATVLLFFLAAWEIHSIYCLNNPTAPDCAPPTITLPSSPPLTTTCPKSVSDQWSHMHPNYMAQGKTKSGVRARTKTLSKAEKKKRDDECDKYKWNCYDSFRMEIQFYIDQEYVMRNQWDNNCYSCYLKCMRGDTTSMILESETCAYWNYV